MSSVPLTLGKLGLGTKLGALFVNVPGCRNAKHVQTRENSHTFVSTHVNKQGSCNVDCRACNYGSGNSVGCVD